MDRRERLRYEKFMRNRILLTPKAAPDPLVALRAAIGDAHIKAAYVADRGITQSGGAVSQWDDARGATGFGPSLVQATGTKQPIAGLDTDAVSVVTFDGVDDFLQSSGSFAFPTAQVSLCIVTRTLATPGVSASYAGLTNGSSAIFIAKESSFWGGEQHGSFNGSVNTTTAIDLVRRLVYLASVQSGNTLRCRAIAASEASASIGQVDSYTSLLLGRGSPTNTTFAKHALSAAFVLDADPSTAQVTALQAFAAAFKYTAI